MTAPADELTLRSATMDDLPVLTVLNLQLIEDQRHDNPAGPDDVEQRMRRWLNGSYQVRLIEFADTVVAYAVWRADADGVYLRQFFVARDKRRSGVGRRAFALLGVEWKDQEVRLDVLLHNEPALAFYRAIGFQDHTLGLRRHPQPAAGT